MDSFGTTMSINELLNMATQADDPEAVAEPTEMADGMDSQVSTSKVMDVETREMDNKAEEEAGEKPSRKESSKRKARKESLPEIMSVDLGGKRSPVADWIEEVPRSKDFVLCRVPRDVQIVLHFIGCQMQVPQWAMLGYVIEDWIKNNYPEFMKWTETGKNR